MREAEMDRLTAILQEKDSELEQIEHTIRSVGGFGGPNMANVYSATKGDAVDEYLAKYINLMQC